MGERRNLARGTTEPVVRYCAGERETVFDHIKAIHAVCRRIHPPARSERAHRFEIALPAIEKIAVQSENHICSIEFRDQPCACTKSALRSKALFLTQERLVNAPAHPGENFFQFCPQSLACGRMRFLDKKRKTLPMLSKQHFAEFSDVAFKFFTLAPFSLVNKPPRARRIVKIENRRLNKNVGCPSAGRMQRIAFELDGAPVHGRGDKRNCACAPGHRGRVIQKFSGNRPLHVFCERNEMHLRLATTR